MGQFNIKSTGEVYVNKALDREIIPSYDLIISASDGAFVSTAMVRVSILDANDNPPICEQVPGLCFCLFAAICLMHISDSCRLVSTQSNRPLNSSLNTRFLAADLRGDHPREHPGRHVRDARRSQGRGRGRHAERAHRVQPQRTQQQNVRHAQENW